MSSDQLGSRRDSETNLEVRPWFARSAAVLPQTGTVPIVSSQRAGACQTGTVRLPLPSKEELLSQPPLALAMPDVVFRRPEVPDETPASTPATLDSTLAAAIGAGALVLAGLIAVLLAMVVAVD